MALPAILLRGGALATRAAKIGSKVAPVVANRSKKIKKSKFLKRGKGSSDGGNNIPNKGQTSSSSVSGGKIVKRSNNFSALSNFTSEFVGASSEKGSDSSKDETKVLLSIKEKVIKIDKLLKDNFLLIENRNKIERIQRERAKRKAKEDEIESKKGPKKKDKKSGGLQVKTPSFLDGIKNFFLTVLAGWLFNKLVPILPKLVPILGALGKGIDFALDIFSGLLSIFSKVLEFGINIYNTFVKGLGWILGFRSEQDLEKFKKGFNRVVDLTLLAAMLILNFSGGLGNPFNKKRRGAPGGPGGGGRRRPTRTTSGGKPIRKRDRIRDVFGRRGGPDVTGDTPGGRRKRRGGRPRVTTGRGGRRRGGLGGLACGIPGLDFVGDFMGGGDDLDTKPKSTTPDGKPKVTGAPDTPKPKPKGGGIFGGVGDFISGAADNAKKLAGGAVDSAKKLAGGAVDNAKKLTEGVVEAGKGIARTVGAIAEGASGLYKNTVGKLGEVVGDLYKKGKDALFAWLKEQPGVLGKLGKAAPDLLKKLGKYIPFVGDVLGFVFDIVAGIDWRRALIRAVVGATIDAGFTALMAALGLATPFTGGASGILATVIYAAYMAADVASGGFGVILGDKIADFLKIPMKAGEKGGDAPPPSSPGGDSDIAALNENIEKKKQEDPEFAKKIAASEKDKKTKDKEVEKKQLGGFVNLPGLPLPGQSSQEKIDKPFKPKKQQTKPGKDVGGVKQISKLFPDSSGKFGESEQSDHLTGGESKGGWFSSLFGGGGKKDKGGKTGGGKTGGGKKRGGANALKSLTETSEELKKVPFVGSLMGASVDIAMGQKPDKDLYHGIASNLIYLSDVLSQSLSIGEKFDSNSLATLAAGGEVSSMESATVIKEASQSNSKALSDKLAYMIEDGANKSLENIKRHINMYQKPSDGGGGGGDGSTDGPGSAAGNRDSATGALTPGSGGGVATGAVAASDLYKQIGANAEQWDIYRNSVALIESNGDYSIPGGSGMHYDGRYQMGAAAKTDGAKYAGLPDPGHSDDPNAQVRAAYRANPELQEKIFTGYTLANHTYLMRNETYKNSDIERKLQILGYAHNQGMGNAEDWLETGVVGKDGFGTKGTKYTDLIAANFRAQKSGGELQVAEGAVNVPSLASSGPDIKTSDPSSRERGEGSKIAGELGRFLDSKGLGKWGDGVWRHPEHPKWFKESGHRAGSLHYESQGARAIDIGGYGPVRYRNEGYTGTDDQTQIIAGINEFNSSKGVNPVEFAHEGNDPRNHNDHVHVAYFRGGRTKEGPAKLHEGEFVTDKDSTDIVGVGFMNIINQIETVKGFIQKVPVLVSNLLGRTQELDPGLDDGTSNSSPSVEMKLSLDEDKKLKERDTDSKENIPPLPVPPDVDSTGKPIITPPRDEPKKYMRGGEVVPKGVDRNIGQLEQFADYEKPNGIKTKFIIQQINTITEVPSSDGSNPEPSVTLKSMSDPGQYQSILR